MVQLLEVRELYLHYADRLGNVHAVDGVSFALEGRGQALGIVGESGSGKTSLALAIMRMLPDNVARFEGEVFLEGRESAHLPEAALRQEIRWRKIALVPQGAMNSFNPVLRVGEQVIEPLLVSGQADRRSARRRAEELLALVGLPGEVYDRFPHELSGGMKQRAMIASALIMSPALAILDEPTSALDVSVQAQITNLLKRLKQELRLSILFITHDIAVASDVCDCLAVMYAGELVEWGSAEQVLTTPAHPYTQKLLASVPRLRGPERPAFIPGAPPDLRQPPPGCRFHPRCAQATRRCQHEPPPIFQPRPGQRVRCWLPAAGANGYVACA
ncbi:MAG: ABC transporter ATP-binding protein [Anaerolineae bacterium]|nr:ABC transporter ATP-binding protein [Anaerolineae bacterium]